MILGDFNIDYLNNNEIKVLKELMDIYINPQMSTVLRNSIVSIYYSDHEAIKVDKVSLIFI